MARPSNALLRDNIRFRRLELQLEFPLLPVLELHQKLAAEFEVSLRSVWYYLRTDDKVDTRIRYTPAERERLCGLTRKQLQEYAAQTGQNFGTLYTMVWRYKMKSPTVKKQLDDYAATCQLRGRMDFARRTDLKAFGLPGDAFKEARKVIRSVQSLELLPPNYIIHAPSWKFYMLSLSEQIFLLTNPRRFLREKAAHISHNWKSYDPKGSYFVLVNSGFEDAHYEGKTISTHDTLELAAKAAQAILHSDNPVPTKILRRHGETRSTYTRFVACEMVPKHAPGALPNPKNTIEFIPAAKPQSPITAPTPSALDLTFDSLLLEEATYDENLAEPTPEEWEEEDRMSKINL